MVIRKTRDELDAEMDQMDRANPRDVVETTSPVDTRSPVETGGSVEAGGLVEAQEIVETVPEAPAPPTEEENGTEAPLTPKLLGVIESLLFAAGNPLPIKSLLGPLQELQPELNARDVRRALEKLKTDLREQGRGVRVAEVAGGFQLRTPSEASPFVKKLVTRRPPRLTRATLETLSIVAYQQPVTRGEVEEIRGVDCGAVLKHLLDKRLVRILGRKDEPGRPLLYGTSKEFLEFFSLKDLTSLPTLREFVELSDEHKASLGLEAGAEEAAAEEDTTFQVEFTDDYAPVGHDEVVQELDEALQDVRKRDRALRKKLPVEPKPAGQSTDAPGQQAGDGAQQQEQPPAVPQPDTIGQEDTQQAGPEAADPGAPVQQDATDREDKQPTQAGPEHEAGTDQVPQPDMPAPEAREQAKPEQVQPEQEPDGVPDSGDDGGEDGERG